MRVNIEPGSRPMDNARRARAAGDISNSPDSTRAMVSGLTPCARKKSAYAGRSPMPRVVRASDSAFFDRSPCCTRSL